MGDRSKSEGNRSDCKEGDACRRSKARLESSIASVMFYFTMAVNASVDGGVDAQSEGQDH